MNDKEIGSEDVIWINLAQDMDKAVVNTVMYLWMT